MLNLTVLGSTGSIGTSTLDVVRQNRERYGIFALAAGQNVPLLIEQIRELRPAAVVLGTKDGELRLLHSLSDSGIGRSHWPEVLSGPEARVRMATADEAGAVVSAIV